VFSFVAYETKHWVCKPALFGACPKPGQIRRVAAERAFGVKWGDDGGRGSDSPDGVASGWIIGASGSVIFPCTIKSRRWRALTE